MAGEGRLSVLSPTDLTFPPLMDNPMLSPSSALVHSFRQEIKKVHLINA